MGQTAHWIDQAMIKRLNLHQLNPFLLVSLLLLPALVLLWRRVRLSRRADWPAKASLVAVGLYGFLLGCGLVLEHYLLLSCPVSHSRFAETAAIFQDNLSMLADSPWHASCFVAEGTMLAVAQKRDQLNIGEQETNIFCVADAESERDLETELSEMARSRQLWGKDHQVEKLTDQWLVQVHGPNGGRGNIWMLRRSAGQRVVPRVKYMRQEAIYGQKVVYNPSEEWVLPEEWALPTELIWWNGVPVPVAQNWDKMLAGQFGPDFMKSNINRVQCIENFWTRLFPSPLFFFYLAAIAVLTAGLPVAFNRLNVSSRQGAIIVELRSQKAGDPKPAARLLSGAALRQAGLGAVAGLVLLYGLTRLVSVSYQTPMQLRGPLSQDQLNQFERDGLLVIKADQWLTDGQKKELVDWTHEVQHWPEKKFHWMKYFEQSSVDDSKLLNRVENFIPYHSGLGGIFNGSKTMVMLDQLMGGRCVLYKDKINMKLPGAGGFEPHQDILAGWGSYNVSNFVTFSVSIDHAHEKNGALEVVRGEHRRGKLADDWSPLSKQVVDSMNWEMIKTQPGDVIIFDAFAPHRSAPNGHHESRRNLYLTYNRRDEGDHRDQYFVDKRANYPPDIEREVGKKYEYKI